MSIKKLKQNDRQFPEILRHIPASPKELFIKGADNLPSLLEKPRLAVVGSRKYSPYGKAVTVKLVSELARSGVVIVSGLAIGIDSIAHQAVLEGGGATIAVLACGLDRIYPAHHRPLADRLIERGGAIISEYPESTEAFKSNFVARNRLISGLADGLLVCEAAARSGTMHTARFALEQGKTVMAVPGNITSFTSEGTNSLIKAGATPVTCTSDILAAMNIEETKLQQQELIGDTAAEQTLLDLLNSGISDGSLLQAKSALGAAEFNQALTMLELNGRVRPLGANHWMLS